MKSYYLRYSPKMEGEVGGGGVQWLQMSGA